MGYLKKDFKIVKVSHGVLKHGLENCLNPPILYRLGGLNNSHQHQIRACRVDISPRSLRNLFYLVTNRSSTAHLWWQSSTGRNCFSCGILEARVNA